MMVPGKIKNGVVVLGNGSKLPEGTNVTVSPVKKSGRKASEAPGRRKLLRHAGKAQGLPADAARNVDHYLYGHDKQ